MGSVTTGLIIISTAPVTSVSGLYMGGKGPPGLNTMECHLDENHTTVSPFLIVRLPGKNSVSSASGGPIPAATRWMLVPFGPSSLSRTRSDDWMTWRLLVINSRGSISLRATRSISSCSGTSFAVASSTTITPLWKSCMPQT